MRDENEVLEEVEGGERKWKKEEKTFKMKEE
jgi:hypothetical protein